MINYKPKTNIGCLTLLLIVFLPPFAVIGKGLKAFVVTTLCTIFGFWVLGSIAAALYLGD